MKFIDETVKKHEQPYRILCILGQQGGCLYAQDRYGTIWYRILPDGEWNLVAR